MPYLGKSPSQGVRSRYQFTPNANTTDINGADANGDTLTFTDGNYVDVYLNGVMLKAGTDYNTTTANQVTLTTGTAAASDIVDIIVYDTFSLFGGTLEGNVKVNNGTFNVTGATDLDSTLNVDGAITGTSATFTVDDNSTILNLVSTDADANTGPRIDITRNSASPAANDYLGQIRFMGEDAADNSLSYVSMFGQLLDPTDGGEDGSFELDVRLAGSNRSRMISNATETVFNDDSVDLDFRVETDGNANMLVVDGGSNIVRIGGTTNNSGGFHLKIGDSGNDGEIGFYADQDGGQMAVYDRTNSNYEQMLYNASQHRFDISGSQKMMLDSNGNVGIGCAPSHLLDLNASSTATLRFQTGSNQRMQITNTSSASGIYSHNENPLIFGTDSGTSNTERMRIDSSGKVGIGITPLASTTGNGLGAAFSTLAIKASDTVTQALSIDATNAAGPNFMISSYSDGSGSYYMLGANLLLDTSGNTAWETNGEHMSGIQLDSRANNGIQFITAIHDGSSYVPAERARIMGADLLVGRTSVGNTGNGHTLRGADSAIFSRDATGESVQIGRNANDGQLIQFRDNGTEVGDIRVDGTTVSLTGFAGNHESSGISESTETGTVVSTIDELDTRKLADGSTVDHKNHAKIKVSDSVGDKRVYGVLNKFVEHSSGLTKALVTSVGISSIRVTGACEGGDLLESNGNGTAKVQSDDIIRSKTIGKVTIGNSDTGVKLVSCVLYCG